MQSKISTAAQLELFNESALPEAVTLHADRPGFFMRSGQRDPRLHKLIDQIVEIVCSMDHTRTRA